MDLLFTKYASPFNYLDTLLASGRLADGIMNIWDTDQDNKAWQYYLRFIPQYFDGSFEDFKKKLKQETPVAMSKGQVDATVQKSQSILKNFNPLNQKKNSEE